MPNSFPPGGAPPGAALPDGYTVGPLLGEGGMGRVYEATRSRDGQRVAIKVLRADARSAAARRTLLNEAVATAHLAHPNLVAILDVGEHPQVGVYLVQELVLGTSLDVALEFDGHVDEGLATLMAVLDGLTVAHAGNVVHGDLKPSNVLLTASGLVKVCDFGVAQALGPRKDAGGRRIRAGTPQYMAPEQFETSVDLDPRADLYAVGAMLYQVLTGLLPHRETESLDGILEEKRRGVGVPRFDRLGRPVPPALGALVASLTHPDLRERPRFAAGVLQSLRAAAAVLRGTAAPAPRPSSPAAAAPPSRLGAGAGTELLPTRPFGGAAIAARAAPALGASAPRVDTAAPFSTAMPSFVAATHLPGTAFIHLRPPTLVGRTHEIAALRGAMRDAIEARDARAVILEGEEGVGKSRLAEWGLAECERTGLMEGFAARFAIEGSSPARGLRGLVTRLFAPASIDAREGTLATARWLASRGEARDLDFESLAGWLATRTEDDAVDAHTAAGLASSAIRAYAAQRPLYLWLDDAVWATDGTFELVERLLTAGQGPIVIVITCNAASIGDARGRARHDALLATGRASRVAVERLDAAGRAALLRATAPLSRSLAEELARTLETTPLVLVQLVGDWLDRGLLAPGPDGLVAPDGIPSLLDARTPTDVFRGRALGLLAAVREAPAVLHAVALLGPWCSARALHLVGAELGLEQEVVDLVVEEAIVRGVLRAEGGDSYRLEHQVFRVELARAAAADRGYDRLAAAVAHALLDVYGRERPDVRAYAALWLREAGLRTQATEALLEATDQMARGGDLEAAARQLDVARGWLDVDRAPADDVRRDLVIYIEARVAYFSLAYDQALLRALEAVRRFAARGDEERRLKTMNLELRILFYMDRLTECETLMRAMRHGMASAITQGGSTFQHHLHLAADLSVMRGDLEGARDMMKAAVTSIEGSGSWYLVILYLDLAACEAAVGCHDEARAVLQKARRERPHADVYQLANLREGEHFVSLAGGERRLRAFYQDLVEDRRARGDRWRLTAAALALAEYDLRFDEPTARGSALSAIEAFTAVSHDEALSHAFLRSIAARLRARDEHDLAARAEALLAARHQVGRTGMPLPRGSAPAGSTRTGPTKPSA